MLKTGTIYGINGPVIYLKGNTGFRMSEMVYVGHEKLVGEVISLDKDLTTIQVYEETTGLRPGEEVTATGSAVSVTLAPGILNNIFDGIERPLEKISETGGAFISTAATLSPKCRRHVRSCINVWFRRIWRERFSRSFRTASIRSTRCSL